MNGNPTGALAGSPFGSCDLLFQIRHVQDNNLPPLHLDDLPIDQAPQVTRDQVADGPYFRSDLLIGLFKRKLDAAPGTHADGERSVAKKPCQPVADFLQRKFFHERSHIPKPPRQRTDYGKCHLGILTAQVEELAFWKKEKSGILKRGSRGRQIAPIKDGQLSNGGAGALNHKDLLSARLGHFEDLDGARLDNVHALAGIALRKQEFILVQVANDTMAGQAVNLIFTEYGKERDTPECSDCIKGSHGDYHILNFQRKGGKNLSQSCIMAGQPGEGAYPLPGPRLKSSHCSCASINLDSDEVGYNTSKIISEEARMAYVIAEPCIGTKDTACVDVCPVDCIHPRKDEPNFADEEMLYIDPVECIDCGACVPVCPVSAIFPQDDLPEKWKGFIERNAQYYKK